jgi:predicted ATPase
MRGESQALLIERDAEVARLGAAIDAGVTGDGQVLVIDGPAGIGKTALLDVARARASQAGIAVLHARGNELEGHLPYGVVRQLFEPVLRDARAEVRRELLAGAAELAAAILAPDGRVRAERDGDVGAFAVTHGLYWLTANLSSRAPVMIAVDDAHWADGPSLRFLRYLAHRLGGVGAVLVLAGRSGELPDEAESLATLSTLATSDGVALIRARDAGAPDPPLDGQRCARAGARRAGGGCAATACARARGPDRGAGAGRRGCAGRRRRGPCRTAAGVRAPARAGGDLR